MIPCMVVPDSLPLLKIFGPDFECHFEFDYSKSNRIHYSKYKALWCFFYSFTKLEHETLLMKIFERKKVE